MVVVSSLTTISTHLILGSLSFCTCFFTVASKARSGVKRPVLHPGRRGDGRWNSRGQVGNRRGVKAKQSQDSGVEDGTGIGGDGETPTQRKGREQKTL